jgi:hypothetical protein
LISDGALWQLDFNGPPVREGSLPDPLAASLLASDNSVVPLADGKCSIETSRPPKWYNVRMEQEEVLLLDADGTVLQSAKIDMDELNRKLAGRPPIPVPTFLPPALFWWYVQDMTRAAVVQSIILSLMLTVLVVWRERQRGTRGWPKFAWAAFTLVAGLAGAMAYAMAHWDRRTEACPECGKRRPIACDACPHCGATWPKPAKSGFEVLEPG